MRNGKNIKFICAILCAFFVSMTNQIVLYTIGIYFKEANRSIISSGIHLSIFSVGALFSRIFLLIVFSFNNKYRVNKKILILGMSLVLFSAIVYTFVSKSSLVMIARFIQGIGFGIAGSVVPDLVIQNGKNNLMSNVSVYGIACTFSTIIGPMLGIEIIGKYEYRGIGFQLIGEICFIMTILSMFMSIFLDDTQIVKKEASKLKVKYTADYWKSVVCLLFILCICNGYMTTISLWGETINRLEIATLYIGAASMGALIIRFIISSIEKVMQRNRILATSAILCAFCSFGVEIIQSRVMFMIAGFANGILGGLIMTIFHCVLLEKSEHDQIQLTNTIFLFIQDISMIVCGTVWSLITTIVGVGNVFFIIGILFLGIFFMYYDRS